MSLPAYDPAVDDIRIPKRVIEGDFAGWLRDAMNARRMSARMVGLRTGLNHSGITRLLYGGREPTVATLVALLRLFGDDPARDQLVDRGRSEQVPPRASAL
jgi:transcriptional regulator with XRE-family HTH domain